MKKIFCILSAALLLAGCNFLDFDESSSDYSREDMYLTYSNIQKMLTNIYGYLPIEVQEMIAEGMGVPLEKVYGVATFYAQFALSPKGEHNVSVCLGTACYVKGSGDILDKFKEKLGIDVGECTPDGKFSLEACRCLGACGLAPVLTVNGEVYGRLTTDDVDKILAKYSE